MAYRLQMQRFGAFTWQDLELDPSDSSDSACDCCGTTTRRVRGFIHHRLGSVAAYYVGWTLGKRDHGATFDLIVGAWGEKALREQRAAVFLDYRVGDGGKWFHVADAAGRFLEGHELVGYACARSDVTDTPLAPQVFAIVDAIMLGDPRLDEVRAWT